ncbi:TPA: hypothetical protein ACNUUR_000523 [Aeromonas salmonicida]
MSTYKKILEIAFRTLSKKLSVDEKFIVDIYDDEQSWSFISKLAQLFEGVFTEILVQRLNEPETFGMISNLPQSTRIALSHDLKIINKEQKLIFLTIAEIRNDYIHNIPNMGVSLNKYLSRLKKSRQTEIFKRFKPFISDKEITSEKFIEDCKNQIFIVCALEILTAHANVEALHAKREHKNFRAEQAEKILPKKLENSSFIEDRLVIFDHVENARDILKKNGLL